MSNGPDTSHDDAWYRTRWNELTDLLPVSDPDDVVERVRELQIHRLDQRADALTEMGIPNAAEAKRVLQQIFERLQTLRRETQSLRSLQSTVGANSPEEAENEIKALQDRIQRLERQHEVLAEAGFENPEHAARAIQSMEQQLEELYVEKEATEQSSPKRTLDGEGDTFDQLQALIAREEELQRELGIAAPGAIIEMVEGLTDQLEDVYRDRDAEMATDPIFPSSSGQESDFKSKLEDEFGVSDPSTVIAMVDDLNRQVDTLRADREQLAELDLESVDEAIGMIQNMQQQLESVYEGREKLSARGIDGIDHAISMIESMENQLSDLYDEREHVAQEAVDASAEREKLESQLRTLAEEKEALQQTRDRLASRLRAFEEEFGTDDPETLSNLIGSLDDQLRDVYEKRERRASNQAVPDEVPLPEDVLAQLDDLSDEALNELPAGVFCVDDSGTVQRTNNRVLTWPGVDTDDPTALHGMNFFADVAPATNSRLFRGRFDQGVENGDLDEQFLYTYVSEAAPPSNLAVHLRSSARESLYWILFRVL